MATFKKVLIVDDDDLFLLVSKSIMEDEGFAEQIYDFERVLNAYYPTSTDTKLTTPLKTFSSVNSTG